MTKLRIFFSIPQCSINSFQFRKFRNLRKQLRSVALLIFILMTLRFPHFNHHWSSKSVQKIRRYEFSKIRFFHIKWRNRTFWDCWILQTFSPFFLCYFVTFCYLGNQWSWGHVSESPWRKSHIRIKFSKKNFGDLWFLVSKFLTFYPDPVAPWGIFFRIYIRFQAESPFWP